MGFTRGTCFLEHGDETTAIVGVDGDSVFYLASRRTLEFLRRRHPPVGITEQTVVTYARQALEIADVESGKTTLLRSLTEVPAEARGSITRRNRPLFAVASQGQRAWHITLTFRELGGYYAPAIVQHEPRSSADGSVLYVDSKVLWSDPTHQ